MNTSDKRLPKIVCVLGPTGSGKNDLALDLRSFFPLEVINFDSRQVYADLPVVTAQPSEMEKKLCPHHLYGFLGLQERISAGKFVEMARQCIAEVTARGSIPFLVGGTGLYLRSLTYGLADIPLVPQKITDELEKQCLQSGVQLLYQSLKLVDPDYAGKITGRDRQKIVRALGVYEASGKPFSIWHKEQSKTPLYDVLKLGIMKDLNDLEPDLDTRISRMIDAGAVEEVKKAWTDSGYDAELPAFSGIGCREIIDYIQGETDLEQTRKSWLKKTRSYAKRQLTWFRKEQDIKWLQPGDMNTGKSLVNHFLEK